MSEPQEPTPVEFRVTFGQKYAREQHPQCDSAHPDGWLSVVTPVDDETVARDAVVGAIGRQWAFIYHPEDPHYPTVDGLYPRGEIARMIVAPDHQSLTSDEVEAEWAVIAYDVEKGADRVETCDDEADARSMLAYQQRSMRLRDARIVTRNATPWLPFQTETEEQS